MSDRETPDMPADKGREIDPEMRRGVSRRSLLTDELGRASLQAVKQLPGLAGILGHALRETTAHRDERLVTNLWQLVMGRVPKREETEASMEVVLNAKTADEKGDALVDILWALCQTKDFEEIDRSHSTLIRGLYRIALDRDPTDDERSAALEVMADAQDISARAAALEGLFTGLIRSWESVLRKEPARGGRR